MTETFSGPNCFKISLTIVDFPAPVPPATPTTIDFDPYLTNAIKSAAMMFEGYFVRIFFFLTEKSGKPIGRTSEKFLTK